MLGLDKYGSIDLYGNDIYGLELVLGNLKKLENE
jgi:hypothetical protein